MPLTTLLVHIDCMCTHSCLVLCVIAYSLRSHDGWGMCESNLSLSLSHMYTPFLSLSLSLSHTHTHTHTHPPFSLSFSVSLSLFCSPMNIPECCSVDSPLSKKTKVAGSHAGLCWTLLPIDVTSFLYKFLAYFIISDILKIFLAKFFSCILIWSTLTSLADHQEPLDVSVACSTPLYGGMHMPYNPLGLVLVSCLHASML